MCYVYLRLRIQLLLNEIKNVFKLAGEFNHVFVKVSCF